MDDTSAASAPSISTISTSAGYILSAEPQRHLAQHPQPSTALEYAQNPHGVYGHMNPGLTYHGDVDSLPPWGEWRSQPVTPGPSTAQYAPPSWSGASQHSYSTPLPHTIWGRTTDVHGSSIASPMSSTQIFPHFPSGQPAASPSYCSSYSYASSEAPVPTGLGLETDDRWHDAAVNSGAEPSSLTSGRPFHSTTISPAQLAMSPMTAPTMSDLSRSTSLPCYCAPSLETPTFGPASPSSSSATSPPAQETHPTASSTPSSHVERSRSDAETRLQCPVCNKSFQRPHNVKQHQETHLPSSQRKKPHQCRYPDCDQSFRRATDLERHDFSVSITWVLNTQG